MNVGELGVFIPILAIFFAGVGVIGRGPLGRALARRIGGEAGGNPELASQVQELRQDLDAVRHELAEAQERLDFTERALTQVREAQRLPKGPT